MSKNSKIKKQKSKKNYPKIPIFLLPLLFALVVIPLILRLKLVVLDSSIYFLWNGKKINPDFFSYYKGVALIFTAAMALLMYFFYCGRESFIGIRRNSVWYLSMFFLCSLMLLSFLLSNFSHLTFSGAPDRYEGILVWMAYFILFFYSSEYEFDVKTYYWIVGAVFFFTMLISVFGFFQYIEKDLFETEFFRRFIIPSSLEEYRKGFYLPEDAVHNLYGTSYHYNYMGSLAPMLLAFSAVLALFHPDVKLRGFSFVAVLMSFFLLFGSTARSGIVALLLFVFFMLIFFAKRLIGDRKKLRVFLATGGILLLIIAVGAGKSMFYRIPSLLSDVKGIFRSEGDYREKIALKNVSLERDRIRIEIEDQILVFEPREERLTDGKGKEIKFTREQEDLWALSAPYENYRLAFVKDKNSPKRYIKIDNGRGIELYFLDTGEEILATNPKGLVISLEEAPSFGFAGKERLGSSRGYIWSRTLPLLKSRLLVGYGPDSFLAVFPQGDIYAKLYAYDRIWTVVDKPHNLYLQMVVNAGWLFLLVFLFMTGKLICDYFRRYHSEETEIGEKDAFGLACFMAVIAYLGAGFFNDSVLSVAPIFWVFFGLAIAVIKD